MHLSERELKHLSDLRKYVHNVQRWRWFYVGGGIALPLMFFAPMFYFLATGLEVKAKMFGSHPAIILLPILGGFLLAWESKVLGVIPARIYSLKYWNI